MIGALVGGGGKALAEVADLEARYFVNAGLGNTLEGLRRLAESGGRWEASCAAAWG